MIYQIIIIYSIYFLYYLYLQNYIISHIFFNNSHFSLPQLIFKYNLIYLNLIFLLVLHNINIVSIYFTYFNHDLNNIIINPILYQWIISNHLKHFLLVIVNMFKHIIYYYQYNKSQLIIFLIIHYLNILIKLI